MDVVAVLGRVGLQEVGIEVGGRDQEVIGGVGHQFVDHLVVGFDELDVALPLIGI